MYIVYIEKVRRGGFLCRNNLSILKDMEFFRKGGPEENKRDKRIFMNIISYCDIIILLKIRPIFEMPFSEAGRFFK